MAFLKENDKQVIRNTLSKMTHPVKLVLFTQELECMYCRETKQILEELVDLSDLLTLEIYNFQIDKEAADQYGVDKVPAIAIIGEKDAGIRFYGIPSGYEFASLLEDIVDVSNNKSGFSDKQMKLIDSISSPVHIQVFVTPTCPYCPQAVRTAHRLALASSYIKADMVEASEFHELSKKYNVRGVPRSIINEDFSLEGAVPEDLFIAKVMESVAAVVENVN